MPIDRPSWKNIDGSVFSKNIDEVLSKNSVNYRKEVVVGGIPSDYYIVRPSGGTIILEVKLWEPTPDNITRAINYSKIMTSGSGVNNSYIVMPEVPNNLHEPNIITPDQIMKVIEKVDVKITSTTLPQIKKIPKESVFIAMPFSKEYDDTYLVGIVPVITKLKYIPIRIDEEPIAGDIAIEIKQKIADSSFVIADVSEAKPNVLYEMGFAEGKQKRVFQVCSTPLESLPFDIRNNQTIAYCKGQTSVLAKNLGLILRKYIKNNNQEPVS
jgi:hypothetical protein